MFKSIKYTLLSTVVIAALSITACGTNNTSEATQESNRIETAVAETVAAQNASQEANTSTPAAPVFTQTPLVFVPTLTPLAPSASPTLPANASKNKCASASLVSETIPDGTIIKPEAQFTKTWKIQNTSLCTWDTTYKIVFWDGDLLGGAYYYNLPQIVAPGQTVPISLVLTAPKDEASYTSKWMLQTPDNIPFGVGQYDTPFYAQIAVSASATPSYAVTAVDYEMVRDPAEGCPANVNYILYATIATSGPVEIQYYWTQSDGNNSNPQTLKITSATTTTLSHNWKLHIATNTGTRWMSIAIGVVNAKGEVSQYTEYPHVEFTKTCGG
jgi:hypothetical protein